MKSVIIFVAGIIWSMVGFSQKPVISNRSIGFADTILAMLTGQIKDTQNVGVYSATIDLTDLHSGETWEWDLDTNSNGYFKRYFGPGDYSVEFHMGGYGQVKIDTLRLTMGQIQEVIISGLFLKSTEDWVTVPAKVISSKNRLRGDDLHFDPAARAWKNIKATIQLIREDRVAALSGRVVYPLRRENPLPDIKNGAQFCWAYTVLFDSTLKAALAGLKSSDLFGHEGKWSYGEGDVWFGPDGKIFAINYSSPAERRRKDSLTAETYRLLYPGIAHWNRNLLVCKVGKRLIRVDEVGDDLRYIAWGAGKTISDKPDKVLFKGVKKIDGTLGSYTITFSNGPWTYLFDYTALADSGDDYPFGLYLSVLKNGKKVGRYACMEVK